MKSNKVIIVIAILLLILAGINLFNSDKSVSTLKVMSDSKEDTQMLSNKPANHETLAQIKQLRDHLAHSPDDTEHWIQLGNLLFDEGQFDQAIDPYQKALTQKPLNNDVRTDYGVCLFNMGRSEDAIKEFDRVLTSDPKHITAMFNLGVVFAHMNKTEKAREYWNRVIKTDPNSEFATKASGNLARLK